MTHEGVDIFGLSVFLAACYTLVGVLYVFAQWPDCVRRDDTKIEKLFLCCFLIFASVFWPIFAWKDSRKSKR